MYMYSHLLQMRGVIRNLIDQIPPVRHPLLRL